MTRKTVISKQQQPDLETMQVSTRDSGLLQALTSEQADVLTNAKAFWFFAEWQEVEALLSVEVLSSHPERGYLHLLLGTALLQLGKVEQAKSCLQVAKETGQPKKLIKRLMLSSAYQTLANIALLREQNQQAEKLYANSLVLAGVKEQVISAQSRKLKALSEFGHFDQAVTEIDNLLAKNTDLSRSNTSILLQQIKVEQNKLKRLLSAYVKTDEIENHNIKDLNTASILVEQCFSNVSVVGAMEAINEVLVTEQYNSFVKYNFCYLVALRFIEIKDNLMAVHYLNNAVEWLGEEMHSQEYVQLSRLALELNQAELSIDLMIKARAADTSLNNVEQQRVRVAYQNIRKASLQKQQHGHDLIIEYLKQKGTNQSKDDKARLFVEVGTTREFVPGQGSTMLIAEMCAAAGFDFITVDMDPNNGKLAEAAFKRHQLPFRAVTQKGEEFLQQFAGEIDFVFLDAYDFDHGKHSALRQSRYMKYLGGIIDEQQCHKMHLDCAIALKDKLTKDGLICVDDTWLDEAGNWTAKGTTAVPYLLQNGFEIIDARNRAVLLKRVKK